MIGDLIKKERINKGMTQGQLAKILDVSPSTIGMYEQNRRVPDTEMVVKMSEFFNVTTDYLLGSTSDPKLTAKDEKDISKKLESILDEMGGSDALMFDGEKMDMDEESKELLKSSIENSLRLAKKLAKEKYTPKKYKK